MRFIDNRQFLLRDYCGYLSLHNSRGYLEQRKLPGEHICLALLSEGKVLLADAGGQLVLWDALHRTSLHSIVGNIGGRHFPFEDFAAVSPDGKRLAVLRNCNLLVFDFQSGDCLWNVQMNDNWCDCGLLFSPNGEWLAFSNESERPTIRRAIDGAPLSILGKPQHRSVGTGAGNYHHLLAFTPDSRMLVTAGYDGEICTWDVATGQRIARFLTPGVQTTSIDPETGSHEPRPAAHDGWVRTLAISAEGVWLASAGNDQVIRLWDVDTSHPRATIGTAAIPVIAVRFAGDHRIIAAYHDGSIRLWDIESGQNIETHRAHDVGQMALAIRGNRLLSASQGVIKLWSLPTLSLEQELRSDEATIDHLQFSSDRYVVGAGWRMIEGCRKGHLELWDIASGESVRTFDAWGDVPIMTCGGWWSVNSMAVSPDGAFVATSVEYEIQIWDVQSGQMRDRHYTGKDKVFDRPTAMTFAPDGNTLAIGMVGFAILRYDLRAKRLRIAFGAKADSVSSLAFTKDGKVLAVATDYDDSVWLHDFERRKLVGRLCGHFNAIESVDTHSSGLIATGGRDGIVKVWRNGRIAKTMIAD